MLQQITDMAWYEATGKWPNPRRDLDNPEPEAVASVSRVRLRRVATRAGLLRKRLVFVVAAPPDARLVAPLGGAVEPLVMPQRPSSPRA
jgi:hypothetical protein